MRYKIEYLESCDEEASAFLATFSDGSLEEARIRAYAQRPVCETAEGYCIRDLSEGGRVVELRSFDD